MEVADIIRKHLCDDVYSLSTKDGWYGNYDKKWLLQQIQSRQKAQSKLPSWYGNFDLLFPPPLSVEQSSSELAAAYKSSLVSGATLVDATGGMGVDSSFFARRFQKVIYMEMQPELVEMARHNFGVWGLNNVEVRHTSDGSVDRLPAADCVFLDPSRRDAGRKVFLLEDCSPDIIRWMPRLKELYGTILVKLSPMYDLTAAVRAFPEIDAIYVVAVHGEVKELLLMISSKKMPRTVSCVNLERGGAVQREVFSYEERNGVVDYADEVETFLYEPHATLMKAGLMNAAAARYGLKKLHPHSHLFTGSQLVPDFFGRIFQVKSVFGMGKSELKTNVSDLKKANITVRNFPIKEADLRKKLKLDSGGEVTLFATTLFGERHVLIRTEKARVSDDNPLND